MEGKFVINENKIELILEEIKSLSWQHAYLNLIFDAQMAPMALQSQTVKCWPIVVFSLNFMGGLEGTNTPSSLSFCNGEKNEY